MDKKTEDSFILEFLIQNVTSAMRIFERNDYSDRLRDEIIDEMKRRGEWRE